MYMRGSLQILSQQFNIISYTMLLFTTADFGISLYHIVVAVLLSTLYVFRYLGITTRPPNFLRKWFVSDDTKGKEESIPGFEPLSTDSGPIVETESRFSKSWWTDDQIFQLERRAIFSKVTPSA